MDRGVGNDLGDDFRMNGLFSASAVIEVPPQPAPIWRDILGEVPSS